MKPKFKQIFGAAFILLIVSLSITVYQGDLPADVVDAKYVSPASQFLTLEDGARIHFRDEGRPDGMPLVLIHGSMASLHTFEPWTGILGDEYRVVTLDLPAHGLTGAVPNRDYSSEAQLKVVKAVIDHLDLERVVIGGNSMGGGVSWRFALAHPNRVLGLVLLNASGPSVWYESEGSEEPKNPSPLIFRLLSQAWFRAIAGRIDPYYLAVQGAESSYNGSPVVDDALVMRYYELALRAGTREAILSRFSQPFNRARVQVDLTLLTQPTLILWGREDAVIPVSAGERFHEVLPNSQLIIYDDVGHVPMEEIPKRSADDVRAFIESFVTEP
jgi:pimeloyl-ACP methyl ester carboxylesterase